MIIKNNSHEKADWIKVLYPPDEKKNLPETIHNKNSPSKAITFNENVERTLKIVGVPQDGLER